MTIYLSQLSPWDTAFPNPNDAFDEPNGLLAMGGDLSPERLMEAYRNGIFPWYSLDEPILWWSPNPRAGFNPATFLPSKSLRKFQRKTNYTVTINQACHQVIEHCANCRGLEQTWITPEMISAYQRLHDLGYCHSVEVWLNNQLVGGFYGIAIGTIFCGESMFSLADNASKIALWQFCRHFYASGGTSIDCQMMNPHLASLGAEIVTRNEFLLQLSTEREKSVSNHCYQPQQLAIYTS
ncbi:TPA: leucyl/phenylalanyl-tRNA--protein transferase [Photobacterium damselae]